jgi:hypothetical protein
MRLLIYLLAMLTGFSAAEAARPVAVTPAAVGQAYAAVADKVAEQRQVQPAFSAPLLTVPTAQITVVTPFADVEPTSPVRQHDVVLA